MPTRSTRIKRWPAIAWLCLAAVIVLTLVVAVRPAPARAGGAHLGYGVSVAPHIVLPPDLLTQLGADWVLVYDTAQFSQFPNQKILYRIDMRGYPGTGGGWDQDMVNLASQLHAAGVDAVAIGNEPNLVAEWGGGQPNARQYTDALCRAYHVFKRVAPNIRVVSAGIAPGPNGPQSQSDLTYIQQMLDAGAGNCFDAFGYHPYGFNQPPEADPFRNDYSFRRTERIYQLLAQNGIHDRQIWITEFGWVRNPGEDGLNCAAEGGFKDFQWMIVSEKTQADYTVRAYQFADSNWPWAGPMFLWNLDWHMYDPADEPRCSNFRYFSMLGPKGAPLPVFYAYQQMPKHHAVYGPQLGATVHDMSRIVEAGCAGLVDMGSFTVINTGYSGEINVDIEPANGPGSPLLVTNMSRAASGTVVRAVVDANGIKPGLYMLPINLRAKIGDRTGSYVVKAWLLVHYPSNPQCVAQFNAAPVK